MKLDFIALDKLVVSKANMRYSKKAPDLGDLLPTVRKRGILQVAHRPPRRRTRPLRNPGRTQALRRRFECCDFGPARSLR